ncbi:hypothetical protein BV25DRAFT_1307776 [Artomyces pyxidatus]|uniref:Uncharacterized protein n=1 Tax=Artomyces pyxidatus TaxID=48021 RepID=A0ACB8SNR8_9AGAM|nr:hypothetical protein BV25DRAFT_1307776 [Artomyces pyxidatus]
MELDAFPWAKDPFSMYPVQTVSLGRRKCIVSRVEGIFVHVSNFPDNDEIVDLAFDNFLRKITSIMEIQPAPILESLTLVKRRDYDTQTVLFGNAVPLKLQHVNLYGLRVPLDLPLLQAPLTSLELRECVIWETYAEMLDTLRVLPSLQSLIVEHEFPRRPDPHPPKSNSVALPCLRNLEIIAEFTDTKDLLDRLSFPVDVSLIVSIALGNPAEDADGWDYLAESLLAHIPDEIYDSLRFEALSISPYAAGYDNDIPVNGFIFHPSFPRPLQNTIGSPSPLPTLGHKIYWSDGPGTEYLPLILKTFILGIESLSALTVGHDGFTPEVWTSIADQVGTVGHITVTNPAAALGLFRALTSRPVPLFQRLRTLCFEQMSLVDGGSAVDEYAEDGRLPDERILPGLTVELLGVLMSRAAVGLGIQRVVVKLCDVDTVTIAALQRGPVHEVEWDGDTRGFSSHVMRERENRI